MATGKVYLVGAGPGDPGLITLRAIETLRKADIVFYDYLVNPSILRHCRDDATLVSLGKHGTGRVLSQEEINERMRRAAGMFTTIVRLKSGDPMVFARAGQELSFLVQHDIPFEIVPGVTAAFAAASYAGIPITHRDAASAVALVTGQESPDKTDSSLDYPALARFPGTLVFYMGVTTVEHWTRALIEVGKPASTPVVAVRRVSLPDQQRLDTTLGELAAVVRQARLRPPVVFVVGDAAAHGNAWSWFEKRPLFGQRVLITRAAHQADDLAAPLAELGADVLLQPAIEIRPAPDPADLDRAIDRLPEFDWLVFSSSNGVRHFLDRLMRGAGGRDIRQLANVRIAAVGPGTAEELAKSSLRADLVATEHRAEALAEAIINMQAATEDATHGAANQRYLLVRASRGREVLGDVLTKAGGSVTQVVAYESVDVATADPAIVQQMAAGKFHWTTVTSSAIARSLVRLFGDAVRQTKLVSISPITSATLRELGYEPAAEARDYTMPGLIAAICSHHQPEA